MIKDNVFTFLFNKEAQQDMFKGNAMLHLQI